MKKHLFGMALLSLCLMGLASVASAQYTSIDDIQVYDATGVPDAVNGMIGQTVTVRGIIDERGQYSSGSHHIVGATGGLTLYQNPTTALLGDDTEVTGTVSTYLGEIQLTNCSFNLISSGNTVTPIPMDISTILSDYENVGWLVETVGVVTSKPDAQNFFMTDGIDTIQVYLDTTTGISFGAVDVGDTYKVISPVVNYFTVMELKPRFQSDLVENPLGDTAPVISGLQCNNWVPEASDPVTLSATITDDVGVASAKVWYRNSDGVTPGSWLSVAMSHTGGNIWAGTIPGGHTGSQVDYYLEAFDTIGQTAKLPGDAPTGFRTLAIGFTSIYAMQTVDPGAPSQDSPFAGRPLNIRGLVTCGTADSGAPSRFFVQEALPNPATDSYAFGGVLVYETTGTYSYLRGDLVEIGGVASEYRTITEMLPHNANAVYLISYGNDLPEAPYVRTAVLADNTTNLGEAWESVWVKTGSAAVLDTLGSAAYDEFRVSNAAIPAVGDSLLVNPMQELPYVAALGDVVQIWGQIEQFDGTYSIRPFADQYLVLTAASPVPDLPQIQAAGGIERVFPNPFNPVTNIKFVVNRENLVQLNVYDLRGQKVRTIVQDRLPADTYTLMWDGKDDAGQGLASGTYFARLRIGAEVVQVRQLSLIK